MNEENYYCLVQDDFKKFSYLVKNGYFETSDFEEAVSKLSTSLAVLYQSIQQNKEALN